MSLVRSERLTSVEEGSGRFRSSWQVDGEDTHNVRLLQDVDSGAMSEDSDVDSPWVLQVLALC